MPTFSTASGVPSRHLPLAVSVSRRVELGRRLSCDGDFALGRPVAREQIQIFLDRQLPSGGFDDVVWEKAGAVEEFGKPPMLPWVCTIIDRRHPDDKYLRQAYPKFVANARFWQRERGGDKEGLFHYGGAAPNFEAGWDNSVRWDHGCSNLWAIDLNCYMIMAYRSLAYMADRLALPDEKQQWLDKAETLGKRVNETLWSDADKAYLDRNRDDKKCTGVLTPASFMPLYVKIATPPRASAMHNLAKDPKHLSRLPLRRLR